MSDENAEAKGNNAIQPDYSHALKYYEQAKKLGHKDKADKVLASLNDRYHNNVPPKEMERGLEALVKNHDSGLEKKVLERPKNTIGGLIHDVGRVFTSPMIGPALAGAAALLLLYGGLPPIY